MKVVYNAYVRFNERLNHIRLPYVGLYSKMAVVFTHTNTPIILPVITAPGSATESDWSEGNAY